MTLNSLHHHGALYDWERMRPGQGVGQRTRQRTTARTPAAITKHYQALPDDRDKHPLHFDFQEEGEDFIDLFWIIADLSCSNGPECGTILYPKYLADLSLESAASATGIHLTVPGISISLQNTFTLNVLNVKMELVLSQFVTELAVTAGTIGLTAPLIDIDDVHFKMHIGPREVHHGQGEMIGIDTYIGMELEISSLVLDVDPDAFARTSQVLRRATVDTFCSFPAYYVVDRLSLKDAVYLSMSIDIGSVDAVFRHQQHPIASIACINNATTLRISDDGGLRIGGSLSDLSLDQSVLHSVVWMLDMRDAVVLDVSLDDVYISYLNRFILEMVDYISRFFIPACLVWGSSASSASASASSKKFCFKRRRRSFKRRSKPSDSKNKSDRKCGNFDKL